MAETGTGEALKTLESALAKLAGQMCDGEGQSRRIFDGLRQELDGVHEQLDTAFTEGAARELVESVIARLSGRLEQAELHTAEALRTLEVAFDEVDARVKTAEARLEDRGDDDRLEALAARLTERIDAVRAEMAETIRAAADDGRIGQIEQTLEEITGQVRAVEQRSAGAIESRPRSPAHGRHGDAQGRRVRSRSTAAIAGVRGEVAQKLADADRRVTEATDRVSGEVARVADTFARGLEDSERRSTEAIERIGGDIARVAGVVEQRLAHADAVGAQALERLGGEIARITERLTERVANAERRSAQAIDDVGDHVARATERLQDRQERISTELSERIRLSEERTARFLDEARERIDQRLSETQRRSADIAPAPQAEPMGFSAYADPAVAPFGADSFTTPAAGASRDAPRAFADAGTAKSTMRTR